LTTTDRSCYAVFSCKLKKAVVGIVLYPFATLIDFANPQTAPAMFCETHLLWKTLDPVPMDSGFCVVPTTGFADCPEPLDVLPVPGGFGSNDATQDQEILAFLKKRGAYDPQPPFNSGHPRKAYAQAVAAAIALMQDFPVRAVALAKACLTTKSAAA
jgi:hypothetical protein